MSIFWKCYTRHHLSWELGGQNTCEQFVTKDNEACTVTQTAHTETFKFHTFLISTHREDVLIFKTSF